jgi:hypothetical protein
MESSKRLNRSGVELCGELLEGLEKHRPGVDAAAVVFIDRRNGSKREQ